MDLIDHPINQGIIKGFLPDIHLHNSSFRIDNIDFENISKKVLENMSLEEEKGFNMLFFMALYDKDFLDFLSNSSSLKELDEILFSSDPLNSLINAGVSDVDINSSLLKNVVKFLKPVVTDLDKVLYIMALSNYLNNNDTDSQRPTFDKETLMIIYLLKCAQKQELQSGYTFRINNIKRSAPILDAIINGFDKFKSKKWIRHLTPEEKNQLELLSKDRANISKALINDKQNAKRIELKTCYAWSTFLDFINYLSDNEFNTLNYLLENNSPEEKINKIEEYKNFLKKVDNVRYLYRGSLLHSIISLVEERFSESSSYTFVSTDDLKPFQLNKLIVDLTRNHQSYNSIIISFHHFRLKQNQETASSFFSLSSLSIARNLGAEEPTDLSIEQLIDFFYTTVFDYYSTKKEIIKNISFESIQQNIFSIDNFTSSIMDFYNLSKRYRNIDSFNNILEEENNIASSAQKRIVKGHYRATKKEKNKRIELLESSFLQMENYSNALDFIQSLDIIYLFCDALRIIQCQSLNPIVSTSQNIIDCYRNRLLNIEKEVNKIVYSKLDNDDVIRLSREKRGIITNFLTEKERNKEKLYNKTFSDIFKDSINELIEKIPSQNINELLETKLQINQRISQIPPCTEKEQYEEWVDEIIKKIIERIVSITINENSKYDNDFIKKKQSIKSIFDKNADLIPPSTLDSLTTAEILFSNYSIYKDSEGFDYSCISIMYYMTLEDCVNQLLYTPYALEVLTPLSETVQDDPGKYISVEKSKLSLYYKNRKAKTTCEIGTLSKLFTNLTNETEYQKYLLNKYASIDIDKLIAFGEELNNIKARRNNAAHGGNIISFDEVKTDKYKVYRPDIYRGLLFELLSIIE